VRRGRVIALCLATVFASTAAAAAPAPRTTPAPWPRPADPLTLAREAGLTPEPHEFFAYHVHAHLDVFVDAKRVVIPAGIGIEISNPAVHRFRDPDGTISYGGISPPCKQACISPLHTHSPDGILHTESARSHPNRLGQFFTEWAVRLTRSCVGGYCRPKTKIRFVVNGKQYTGDPRAISLTNLKEIALVIGKPPASIPSKFPR
jgi:hypothetical protein